MRLFLFISVALVLSGCVTSGANQHTIDMAMSNAEKDTLERCPMASLPSEFKNAFDDVQKASWKLCPNGTDKDPLPRSKSIESQECWKKLVNKYVRPIAKSPKDLDSYLKKSNDIAIQYRDGLIDRNEANLRFAQYWAEYADSEKSYFQYIQCSNQAIQRYVMPVYHNKGLLAQFLSERSAIALKVDEGHLTPQQGDVEIQKALASFTKNEQRANAALKQQNAAAWQQWSRQMQQYSTEMQKATTPTDTGIRTTNCSTWNNQINCTSY